MASIKNYNSLPVLPYLDQDLLGRSYTPSPYHELFTAHVINMTDVDEPISPESFPPASPEQEVARKAILSFLNHRFAPIRNSEKSRTFVNPENGGDNDCYSCSDAERYFSALFGSMENSLSPNRQEQTRFRSWTIVVDDNSEPIILQKKDGIKSSLSLVPLVIDGCEFPAGSLLHFQLHEEPSDKKSSIHTTVRLVTPSDNIKSIACLRLSAFAHEPEERRSLFKELSYDCPSDSLNIEEIAELARKSIPLGTPLGFKAPLSI